MSPLSFNKAHAVLAVVAVLCCAAHTARADNLLKVYCMPGQSCYPSDASLQAFGDTLSGSLVSPSSPQWSNASHLLNPLVSGNHTPAHVVVAGSIEDVVSTVRFVKAHNLLLSVKSTGHCYTGNCQAPKSFTLDLAELNWIMMNTEAGVAHLGPGAVFDDLYAECDAAGMLAVGGMCPTVGMIGFSMGGGHGPLVRSYGLGADSFVDLTVVTANGTLIKVHSEGVDTLHPVTREVIDSSPDTSLWWAMRGGGGGAFGVVVNSTVKIHKAPEAVSYAQCYYPLNTTAPGSPGYIGPEVLQHYFDTVASTSFSSKWGIFLFTLAAPVPFSMPSLNKTQHGIVVMEGFFNGPLDEAQSTFEPLSSFKPEWQLSCEVKSISSFREWHNTRWFGKGFPYSQTQASRFPQRTGADTASLAKVVADATLNSVPFSMDAFCGILLGGAVAEVDSSQSAISPSFRGASMVLEADASWFLASQNEANSKWATDASNAMGAITGVEGSYVNEALIDLPNWEQEFWGASGFQKLQAIKDQWDPTGVFYCGHCIYGTNQSPPPQG